MCWYPARRITYVTVVLVAMTVVSYLIHFDVLWSFCRKLEISSGRFARFADGSAVVKVQKKQVDATWKLLKVLPFPYSS